MPLLIIQFLLGMYANLFLTFPTNAPGDLLAQIFLNGPIALIMHAVVGTLLLILSIIILVFAGFTRKKGLIGLATLGFVSLLTAFMGGVLFVSTGYVNNGYSYLMAVGFIISFILFGALTGRSMQTIHRGNHTSPQRGAPIDRTLSTHVGAAGRVRGLREDSEW